MTYRAWDFVGFIAPAAQIDALRWRCTWCRTLTSDARYVPIDGMGREDLSKWTPPTGLRRLP
ncbi:hypothetical protein [Aureimonas psammosilenae]|uniref:hypothetical protein n=1 Tax=Aureimonas psammosilenae TaxID=2495496 RepID=UPI0012610FF1|nr:hypothetical protein [Aureimonas psammosilenae]